MANQLFSQLNQNQQSLNNVSQMMQTIKSAPNPQQALLNMASSNSGLANVLSEIQQSGGDAKSLFFKKISTMGIDPNTILNQLR